MKRCKLKLSCNSEGYPPYIYFIGDRPKYNGIEGQDLVCSKRRIVIALVDSIMEWDKQLFLMLHQLFSASTDTFWLAVTKTFTWLPLYIVLAARLIKQSETHSTWIFRIALCLVGVLLWDQGLNF